MSMSMPIKNHVFEQRTRHGWSQAELASRAGLSRPEVSAIETGRVVPSTAAALALAGALGCPVEALFSLAKSHQTEHVWAWQPPRPDTRFWVADVGGKLLRIPVEPTASGNIGHDGVAGELSSADYHALACKTLVLASCDPAAGLLAAEVSRRHGLRVIVLCRGSRAGLELLRKGVIHAAGVHLADNEHPDANVMAVAGMMGTEHRLVSVARWEEGIAISPRLGKRSITSLFKHSVRWIGREPGSGARQCLDMLFAGRPVPKTIAHGHLEVAAAVQRGWADAGVCVRLTSEELGLNFLSVKTDHYDICIPSSRDPRTDALVDTVRSAPYRRLLGELPGYAAADGEAVVAGGATIGSKASRSSR